MSITLRRWAIAAALLSIGVCALVELGMAQAKKPNPAKPDLEKISTAIEKGQPDSAVKKMAAPTAAKFGLDQVMNTFKSRAKGGFGVGAKPRSVNPDGIELKLLDLSRRDIPAAKLAKEGDALEKMGYNIAAIAEVATLMPPAPNAKGWNGWANDLKIASRDLAKAAKTRNGAAVDKAVAKLNATCANCHAKYRKDN